MTLSPSLISFSSELRECRRSRQPASQNLSLRWEAIREDIYVWGCTCRAYPLHPTHGHPQPAPQPFRDRLPPPITPCLGPPVHTPDRATHSATGREICCRCNVGTRRDKCVFAHICWFPGCHSAHPGRGCPPAAYLSFAELIHPYGTLSSRGSSLAILIRLGYPNC